EIDVYEVSDPSRIFRPEAMAFDPFFGDHPPLAGLDLAHEIGADDVEGAGLRGKHPCFAELAKHQRPDAVRIARTDELLVGEADQRISPLDLQQGLDELLDEGALLAAGDEVQNHLSVGG